MKPERTSTGLGRHRSTQVDLVPGDSEPPSAVEGCFGCSTRVWSAGCVELPGGGRMLRVVDTTALHVAVRLLGLPLAYRMGAAELVAIILGDDAFGPDPAGSPEVNGFAEASGVTPAVLLRRHLEVAYGWGGAPTVAPEPPVPADRDALVFDATTRRDSTSGNRDD